MELAGFWLLVDEYLSMMLCYWIGLGLDTTNYIDILESWNHPGAFQIR